jgi:hypothetical protein
MMSPASVAPGGRIVPKVGMSSVSQKEAWSGPSATRFGLPGRITIKPWSVGREAS